MKRILLGLFLALCVVHLCEHVVQAVQVYVLNMPLHQAGGILGTWHPWLVHSEVLHYGYAAVMMFGLFWFRDQFSGRAFLWWMVALWIQTWHHFEHLLLFGQAVTGHNFFEAPQPISIIQFSGFLFGTPESGFGGLLTMSHFGICDCAGVTPGTVHTWTWKLLTVRRLEVHLLYNILVTIPMVTAMIRAAYNEPMKS